MSRSKELLMSEAKRCVLYDRDCIDCGECDMCDLEPGKVCDNCGECDRCDLDPNKICDNCMKCLKSDGAEYRAIQIDGVEIDDKDKVELPE